MTSFFLTWLISALALLITAHLVRGFEVHGFGAALVAAAILGLANATLRPILVVLTLPVTILTLGLFLFVVNALTIWIVGSLGLGFRVQGFMPALIGSIILSLVSWVMHKLLV